MTTVIFLPVLAHIDDMKNPILDDKFKPIPKMFECKHFARAWDKVQNVIKVKTLQTKTDQICLEIGKGHNYEVDEITGDCTRNKNKKIFIDSETGLECNDTKNDNRVKVDDWIEKGSVDFIFTKESGITQSDLDICSKNCCISLGNGMTSNFKVNQKSCCILVLEDNHKITKSQIDSIVKECLSQ